jgi:hypothetical protein
VPYVPLLRRCTSCHRCASRCTRVAMCRTLLSADVRTDVPYCPSSPFRRCRTSYHAVRFRRCCTLYHAVPQRVARCQAVVRHRCCTFVCRTRSNGKCTTVPLICTSRSMHTHVVCFASLGSSSCVWRLCHAPRLRAGALLRQGGNVTVRRWLYL